MKKLAIFDLDGTLLNTINDLGTACNFALEKHGYATHPLYAYRFMVGNGVRKLMERAAPDASPDSIDALLVTFKEYYNDHNTEQTEPYPGIPELLVALRNKGVAVAVASNKYQSAVESVVSHFFPEIDFAAVCGQVEDRKPKPDPSIVFSILGDYPTPKSDVIYIGDSAVDMETARRACVESVGVTWGFRPVSELRQAYADHVVSSPAEILNFIGDELQEKE